MAADMMRKAFDNHDKISINSPANYTSSLYSFVLKVFDQLFYDWEINRPLVASYLLDLLNHYSLKINMKMINIVLL